MAREFAKSFYRSKEWQTVREYVLKRDKYLCVKCGLPAEEVHHIIHITEDNVNDPNITLNADNLKSLCKDCHFGEHKENRAQGMRKRYGQEENEYIFDENGYLIRK